MSKHKYKNRSDAIRALTEIAHGVFQHYLVTSENYPNIVRVAAQHGEPHAVAIVSGIRQWLRNELNNPRPPLCLTCDTEFGPDNYPATFSVMLPFANHVGTIITGVCTGCAGRDDLRARAVESLRRVWPGLIVEKGARS
jgi:hypothetical protein